MKRSAAVALVLSGSILAGCGREEEPRVEAARPSQVVTNDAYVEGRGYYHAPFHAWYPHPYNFFSPGLGYYRGGRYFTQPDLTVPRPTYPGRAMGGQGQNVADDDQSRRSGGHATAAVSSRTSDSPGHSDPSVRRGGFMRGGSWGHSSSS